MPCYRFFIHGEGLSLTWIDNYDPARMEGRDGFYTTRHAFARTPARGGESAHRH